jgi:hypothetical protein
MGLAVNGMFGSGVGADMSILFNWAQNGPVYNGFTLTPGVGTGAYGGVSIFGSCFSWIVNEGDNTSEVSEPGE